jgi:acyl-CoA reductase-like NAD-dependent aldehyde dehydrogenase
MFIGGKWISAQHGEEIPIISPVDGQVFGAVSRGKAHTRGRNSCLTQAAISRLVRIAQLAWISEGASFAGAVQPVKDRPE